LFRKLFYFKPKLQGEAAKGIIKKKIKGNKKDKTQSQKNLKMIQN